MAQAQKLAYTSRDTATANTLPRASQIRNVQMVRKKSAFNNGFRYLQKDDVSPHATNDQIFNAQYPKQGLQPSTGQVRPKKREAANDENYFNEEEALDEANEQIFTHALARQEHAQKTELKAKKLQAQLRATRVNIFVMVWASSLWAFVQLPAALFSLVTFAIAGALNGIVSSSNVIVSAATWIAEQVASGVGALFGFDINLIRIADGIFLLSYVFVIVLGLFTITTAFVQYTKNRLRPLSGEKAGLKIGMLLLAIVGYSFPLLNLFPWVLLWMAAVWKYPR